MKTFMDLPKGKFNKAAFVIICLLLIILSSVSAFAEIDFLLTIEEKAYIKEKSIIKAAALDGAAPIQYLDKNNEVQGISKNVLQEISDMTGLNFEYYLYSSREEISQSDADILFGIPINYAFPGMILSKPYLESEAIFFMNSSVDANHLDNKIYAAVKGGELPEGIKEENTIYYDTIEQSLDAIEKGKADYSYMNSYSVAFYTLQNAYKNIVSIPKGKEIRQYCMGFRKNDELLISIINKSISAIDENQMENLILDMAAKIDRKITFSMIMDAFGIEIVLLMIVIMGVLILSVVSNIRAKKKLQMNNRRYEILSDISNEYLFEYFIKTNYLVLSDKCSKLFKNMEAYNKAIKKLQMILKDSIGNENFTEIKLNLDYCEERFFKIISSGVKDDRGNTVSIIGKLIDISEEVEEKKVLVNMAQSDGLTGLYNIVRTIELVSDRLRIKEKHILDAFILIDLDLFKEINDIHGHLAGNQVLIHLGENLKNTFRSSDIIGRIGGDEFCVYMKDICSLDYVISRCQQLSNLVQDSKDDYQVTISAGITLVEDDKSYEDIFRRADEALYQAKRNGRSQIIVFEKDNNN